MPIFLESTERKKMLNKSDNLWIKMPLTVNLDAEIPEVLFYTIIYLLVYTNLCVKTSNNMDECYKIYKIQREIE